MSWSFVEEHSRMDDIDKVFGHLVERNFMHGETHSSCVRDLVEYFKIHVVCLVLFNVCRHLIYTYVHKKTENIVRGGKLFTVYPVCRRAG